jgi:integrase/recombinase XerD
MGEAVTLRAGPTVADAAAAFLVAADLAEGSRRVYRGTLEAFAAAVGAARPLGDLDAGDVQAFLDASRQLAARTYNRKLATVGSFLGWCQAQGWVAAMPAAGSRRRVPADDTRVIPRAELERLWRRSLDLRDKTLWRLLYETAARAGEVLALDVGDLDLPNKRAVVAGKGGGREVIHWQAGSAQLLPRLLRGRDAGPVFLAHRRPPPARTPASVDLCPLTGRARLSYRRASELFTATTGWTLHQLRHSALTHLAEDGVDLPLLAAKSRHRSWRSLETYTRPGPDAVARLTAATDPARRRR